MPKKHQQPDIEYFSFEISGHKPSKASIKHQYDAGGASDIFAHDERLFDEDESRSGELYDAGTGSRLDNSSYNGMEDLEESDLNQRRDKSEDVLKPLKTEHDAAAKWLAEQEVKIELGDGVEYGSAA